MLKRIAIKVSGNAGYMNEAGCGRGRRQIMAAPTAPSQALVSCHIQIRLHYALIGGRRWTAIDQSR